MSSHPYANLSNVFNTADFTTSDTLTLTEGDARYLRAGGLATLTSLTLAGPLSGATTIDASGIINFSNNTATVSKTTGAVIIQGGLGISGGIRGSTLVLDGLMTSSGIVSLSNGTVSTSSANGALVLTNGGLGVAGAINAGGAISSTGLTVVGTSVLGASSGSKLRILDSSGVLYLQVAPDTTIGNSSDLFIGNYGQVAVASSRKIMIKAIGTMGIGTILPSKQLEINSATGDCLRLTYNDADGSATNYADLTMYNGDFFITPSGSLTTISGTAHIGNDAGAFFRIREAGGYVVLQSCGSKVDGSAVDLFIGNYNQWPADSARKIMIKADGKMGIGTILPTRELDINSATGDCLRLIYNDNNGSASNYADFIMTSSGDLSITPSGGDTSIIGTLGVNGIVSFSAGIQSTAYNVGSVVITGGLGASGTITSTGLNVVGTSTFGSTAGTFSQIYSAGSIVYFSSSTTNVDNGSADLFIGNLNMSPSLSNRKIMIKANGRVGIGTTLPTKELEINSANGHCLRLTYNDSDGTATNYTDMIVANDGTLWVQPSSYYAVFDARTYIDHTDIEAFTVRKNGNTGDVFIVDTTNGKVGVNKSLPDNCFHVKQNLDGASGNLTDLNQCAIIMESLAGSNYQKWGFNVSNGSRLYVQQGQYGTSAIGYWASNVDVSNIDFTGQHRNITNNDNINNNIQDYIGLIVYSTGIYNNLNGRDIFINEALPEVELTNTEQDRRVFGVISNREDDNTGRTYESGTYVSVIEKIDGDDRLIINSVGEGMIWVCNKNGPIENGEYITSSSVVGYGRLQDDDLLHNYTVAKITQDCDFSTPERYVNVLGVIITEDEYNLDNVNNYKCNFVGATYHCG